MGLNGLRVLTLESRRGDLVRNLILEHGGECFNAPSVRERPLHDNPQAIQFAKDLIAGRYDILCAVHIWATPLEIAIRVVVDRINREIHPPKDLAQILSRHPEARILFQIVEIIGRCLKWSSEHRELILGA